MYSDTPQIGDLGLAVSVSEAANIKDINGVMPYMAPELFSGCSYSQTIDVYAFGIIMWEISSGENPFHDIDHDKHLALRILKGLRPKITDDTPSCYQNLMQQCWHADPTQRPTAKEIYDTIYSWDTNGIEVQKAEEIRQQNIGNKKETKSH